MLNSIFKVRPLFLLFLVILGCNSKVEKQEISGLESGPDFYKNAYLEVEEAYKDDPTDQLLRQKLYYLEKLEWPPMSLSTLEQAQKQFGLNKELIEKFVIYYEKNGQYASLMELLGTWGKIHELTPEMMQSNISAHMALSQRERSIELLNEYIYDFDAPENQAYVAKQFLKLGDTLMSVYHYSKLYKQDPEHPDLISQYALLLLNIGQPARARAVLSETAKSDTSFQAQFMLAKSLYQMGETGKAKSILNNRSNPQAYEQLTNWYWREERWDSTMFYVDKLIQIDSSRNAIFMKASIYEETGALNASLKLFEILVQNDSTDYLAKDRAQDVSRKIAYLRELASRKKKPIPELSPKTSSDNE